MSNKTSAMSLKQITFLVISSELTTMAEKIVCEWDEILKGKWSAYDVEKSLYLESVKKTSAPDVRAKIICNGLRQGDVPENLRKLYMEAIYGSDAKVHARIMSHIYFIGGKVRYVTFRILIVDFFCTIISSAKCVQTAA